MFAVFKTGGKQYKVAANDVIKVEKLENAEAGKQVVFEDVLLVGDDKKTTVGTPTVKGMKVAATVIEQKKDDKVLVFKKKRRHNYRRKVGHRQQVAWIKIDSIGTEVKKAAPAKKPAAEKTEGEAKKAPAKKPAAKKASIAKKTTAAKKPAAKKTEK